MTGLTEPQVLEIPSWVSNLETFRRWARSDEFPERVRVCYFNGAIWVDYSMETLLHNIIRTCIATALATLVETARLGRFFSDGLRLTHSEVGLSCEPDGLFVSYGALKEQRLMFEEGEEALEAVGTPDMVLEVVSDSSVKKDTVDMPDLYSRAGIEEYWIVDMRQERTRFDILVRGPRGYSAARKSAGWVKSRVFDKAFRLTSHKDEAGLRAFKLESR